MPTTWPSNWLPEKPASRTGEVASKVAPGRLKSGNRARDGRRRVVEVIIEITERLPGGDCRNSAQRTTSLDGHGLPCAPTRSSGGVTRNATGRDSLARHARLSGGTTSLLAIVGARDGGFRRHAAPQPMTTTPLQECAAHDFAPGSETVSPLWLHGWESGLDRLTPAIGYPQPFVCPARFGPSPGSPVGAGLFEEQIASWPTVLSATSRYPPGTALLALKTRSWPTSLPPTSSADGPKNPDSAELSVTIKSWPIVSGVLPFPAQLSPMNEHRPIRYSEVVTNRRAADPVEHEPRRREPSIEVMPDVDRAAG